MPGFAANLEDRETALLALDDDAFDLELKEFDVSVVVLLSTMESFQKISLFSL